MRFVCALTVRKTIKSRAAQCPGPRLTPGRTRGCVTRAERLSIAAEVGRLLEKVSENGNSQNNGSFPKEKGILWIDELSKSTGMERRTIQNWWSAFTKSAGLDMTLAAEVGRLVAKLADNGEGGSNGDSQKQSASQWLDELAKNTGNTAYKGHCRRVPGLDAESIAGL